MEITRLNLSQVYTSRATPTVQAQVNDATGAAPAGKSMGSREASSHVPEHLPQIERSLQEALTGETVSPAAVDTVLRETDGTDTFDRLGGVAVATSLAAWNASQPVLSSTFPYPLGNVIGGGMHGGTSPIQEFLVLPMEAETFPEAVETNAAIYREVRERYPRRVKGLNDESAYILDADTYETLDVLHSIAAEHGARIGVDMAATTFHENGTYNYPGLDLALDPGQHRTFILDLIDEYDLVYVEDPFHEDDMDAFIDLREDVTRQELGCWVVGDDLTTTQADRIVTAAERGAVTGVIIKPNQVGTVTDTGEAVAACREHDVLPVISHRSGETTDTTISDLALAWEIPVIKAGIAGIRVAKLNKLLHHWYGSTGTPELAQLPFTVR